MRTFRLIGTTLLMVMLAVNFTACSDDEDEQTIIEQANLIGKWQSTWENIRKNITKALLLKEERLPLP